MKALSKLKQQDFWQHVCLALSIFAFLASCDNSELSISGVKSTGAARSLAKLDPYEYAESNLSKIGKGIVLTTADNNGFRELVYNEIEKKFDGDYNVLTKTLDDKSKALNVNLSDKIRKVDGNPSDGEPLSAFANVDGKSYNPQVFIPFYEELKKTGKIGIETPTLVVFNGKKKEKDLEEGYTLQNGKISKLTFLVDQEYAKTHEVWVLSINDRTGGDIKKKAGSAQLLDKPAALKKGRVAYVRDYGFLNGVGIYAHKESWASGANDVYVESFYSNGPPSSNASTSVGNYIDDWNEQQVIGREFRTFAFNIGEIVLVQNNIYDKLFGGYGVNGAYGHRYFAFALYEHDSWPESIKIAYITINGYTSEFGYRSAESPYMVNYVDARSHSYLSNPYVLSSSVYTFDRTNDGARVRFGVETYQ